MNLILKLLWMVLGHQAKLHLVKEAKRHGLVAYMRVLQASRRVLVAALLAFFILQIMMISAFGALITGFLLWDHDFQAKLEILFWFFTALFSLPLTALIFALSERVWFRASGAEKMMEDLKKSA